MQKKRNTPGTPVELRRRAEARLNDLRKSRRPKAGAPAAGGDTLRLLQELEVHHIELELQNAELQGARNELEVALEKYTDLYDFAPVAYCSLDEAGAILDANLTCAAWLDVERARLLDRRLPLFVCAAGRPDFLAFLKKAFTGKSSDTCEAELQKEDGGTFWAGFRATSAVSPPGARPWCRVAFVDITARREAEAALRESEKRYRTLFELVPMAVYSCDAAGKIENFNRRAAKLWGRAPAPGDTEKRFCGSFKMFRPDGRHLAHEQCPMAGVLGGRIAEVQDAELIIERPDGSRITVLVNIRPLLNTRGEIAGAINCFHDITGRKLAEAAQRRVELLAASNLKLEAEILRRRRVESALHKSEQHQKQLLAESRRMQETLRRLSHQILHAQEEERKRISRELHDQIAQTLVGINVHLAALSREAAGNAKGLPRKIARTQRLVEKSVGVVHRFARELRPAALDDLGLVPALHAFLKEFTRQTGVRASLTAFADVEKLDAAKRTVLFRVAQEALTNVARHARATQVEVGIEKLPDHIRMKIKDDGRAFAVESTLPGKGGKRLGLLGMRERLEMVGGRFDIASAPGQGTTVAAQIPLGRGRRGGGGGGIFDGKTG